MSPSGPVRARLGNGLRCRQRHSNVCRSCLASDQNIPHACHLKMLLCSRAVAASLGSGLQLRRRPKCAAVNSGSSNHRHMDGLLEIRTWLTRGSQETPAIATVRFKPPPNPLNPEPQALNPTLAACGWAPTIGALIIRIGFWGPLYYIVVVRKPPKF